MSLLLGVLISGAVGTVVFVILLIMRPVSQRMFSKTWHYYSLLVPIVFLLGGAVLAGAAARRIQDFSIARRPAVIFTDFVSVQQFWYPDISEMPEILGIREPMIILPLYEPTSVPISTVVRFFPYMLVVWAFGTVVFFSVNIKKYLDYRHMVLHEATPRTDIDCKIPVVTSYMVHIPMLIGIIKPVIVLPQIPMADEELRIVLAHEMIHYKRKDLVYKMVGFIANAAHWYNPIAYMLSRQLNIMCELSCDEKVAAEMDADERKFYGETILQMLQQGQNIKQGNLIFVTSLCNSKKNLKRRLINMMNAKKTKKRVAVFSLIIAALVIGAGVAVSYAGSVVQARFDDHYPTLYVEAQSGRPIERYVPAVPAEFDFILDSTITTHTVVAGDSLLRIARQHFGTADADSVQRIIDANHLTNPNALMIGQVLIIPDVDYEVFTRPEITILESQNQYRQPIPASAISIEEAAQLGALYIWDMFAARIDGMYVEMHYSDHASSLRAYWSGRVAPTREALTIDRYLFEPMFSFVIDAETGMRIDISYLGRNIRNILSEDELRSFLNWPTTPEARELREAWESTILDILTPEEIEFYTQEAWDFAQRHFNNSTVVDVQLGQFGDGYIRIGPFSSPIFDEDGKVSLLTLGGFTFTVTDDTGRVAIVVIPVETGISPYSSIRTQGNDDDPDFYFYDDGIGVG
ncbi:MAG: LysM peptidoglycan-binding domain-containing protein [Defluviitaleaceae bacterium]|nr:LysM peptidoglycan-binding domain-containing protein [Defluviitaleaceae bacterium]